MISVSCKKNEENEKLVFNYGSFTDSRDGNVYTTIKIGTQTWMAENFRYLPSVVGSYIGSETEPLYYVYGYDSTDVNVAKATSNYKIYGVLYNWPAAKAACPAGWHLPSYEEWKTLCSNLGGDDVAGGKLKSTSSWESPNFNATNESGFLALPGGSRDLRTFIEMGKFGRWWSSSDVINNKAIYHVLYYNGGSISRNYYTMEAGYSVRYVKD